MPAAQHKPDLISARRRLVKAAREISSEYSDRLMPRTQLQKLKRTLDRVEELDAQLRRRTSRDGQR